MAADANERFLIDQFERFTPNGVGLDYGCGDGRLVDEAMTRGLDFWGVEKYYAGHADWQERSLERTADQAKDRIRLLDENDRVPFPDGHFDFVCSNQVIEHVHDLALTIAEIARVTRPGGVGVHLFPTVERLIEPHLGIPLFHRIPRHARRVYAYPFHRARLATASRKDTDFASWFDGMSETFFDNHVRLRRRSTIERAFARWFKIEPIEIERLAFGHPALRKLPAAARHLQHRRSGVALRMRRRETVSAAAA